MQESQRFHIVMKSLQERCHCFVLSITLISYYLKIIWYLCTWKTFSELWNLINKITATKGLFNEEKGRWLLVRKYCIIFTHLTNSLFPSMVTAMGSVAIAPGMAWLFQGPNADFVLKILWLCVWTCLVVLWCTGIEADLCFTKLGLDWFFRQQHNWLKNSTLAICNNVNELHKQCSVKWKGLKDMCYL